MGPEEEATIGSQLNRRELRHPGAVDSKPMSELETLMNELIEQNAIIAALDDRLSPVMNREPEDGQKNVPNDPSLHISLATDAVRTHNRALRRILKQLAV